MSRLLLLGGIALGYYAYTSVTQRQNDDAKVAENIEGAVCPDGYKLSADGAMCEPLDTSGLIENPCPDKFRLSDDGTECVSTEPDLNINTGSAIGDMAANIGISIGTSSVISGAAWAIEAATAARSGAAQAAATAAKAEAQAAAKAAEAAARAAAKKAQELAEGGGAPVVKPGVVLPRCARPALPPPPRLVLTCCPRLRRCKLCKKPYDPKKGCPC